MKLVDGNRQKVGLLISNTNGDNLTGDKVVNLISQEMNEVWFDENYAINYYEPLEEGTIRINYYRSDGNYDNLALWLWGSVDSSVTDRLGSWPDGIDFENLGKYGVYMDIALSDFNELGFLLLDESKEGDDAKIQPDNYSFKDLANHTQIFLKDEDKTIYTNPYFVSTVRLTSARQTSPTEIVAIVSNLADDDKDDLFENVKVTDKDGNLMTISDLVLNPEANQLTIVGDFSQLLAPYTVSYAGDDYQAKTNWQHTDSLYAYDGELGARVSEEGARVDLTVWSPSADSVSVVLYDKDDQTKVVGKIAMVKGDKGEWLATLTQESGLGVSDYRGYYYHYEITRGDVTVFALDPYAKSLAEWNSDLIGTDPSYKVAKAAIVDTSTIGNQELTYADISGYTDREDAIIYAKHTFVISHQIDAGKTVAQVFYLTENGQPQSLAFEEISRTVAGQILKFVIFDTEHFSQYGIIYAQEATQSSSDVATQTSAENGMTPDDQAQASVVETTTTPITVDANLETLSSTDATDTLPATGEKDGTILTFSGVLSLASIALLELKRRKKSE